MDGAGGGEPSRATPAHGTTLHGAAPARLLPSKCPGEFSPKLWLSGPKIQHRAWQLQLGSAGSEAEPEQGLGAVGKKQSGKGAGKKNPQPTFYIN